MPAMQKNTFFLAFVVMSHLKRIKTLISYYEKFFNSLMKASPCLWYALARVEWVDNESNLVTFHNPFKTD